MKTKIVAIVLLLFVTMGVSAATDPAMNTNSRTIELIQRVEEIRKMDLSELNRSERKDIKGELREIQSELKGMESVEALDDKVSISIGAVIIIILLLIIL